MLEIAHDEGLGVITVSGEMTIHHAALAKDHLLDQMDGVSDIRLDLSSVSEMDTAGLQLLILAKQYAQDKKKPIAFADSSRAVKDIVNLYQLDGLFAAASPSVEGQQGDRT